MNLIKIIIGAIPLLLLNIGVLLIPMVETTTCTQGNDDAWLATLTVYTPLLIILLLFSFIALPNAKALKWLTLPQFILIPYSMYISCRYFIGVTFQGNHPCTICTDVNFNDYPYSFWTNYWAPVQLIVLSICAYTIFLFWKR